MSRCLIHGCRLVIPLEGKSICGDLFECCDGDIFVFRGDTVGGDEDGYNGLREGAWEYEDPIKYSNYEPQLTLVVSDYYERRGIATFDSKDAVFNVAARRVLAGLGDE